MAGINETLYGKKDEEVLTQRQVMERLQIKNSRTFMRLINEDRLPYIKIGRKYCVLASELNQWLRKNSKVKV